MVDLTGGRSKDYISKLLTVMEKHKISLPNIDVRNVLNDLIVTESNDSNPGPVSENVRL